MGRQSHGSFAVVSLLGNNNSIIRKWSWVRDSNPRSPSYKEGAEPLCQPSINGAVKWSRTTNPFLTKELHCQLCYDGMVDTAGIEPVTPPCKGGVIPFHQRPSLTTIAIRNGAARGTRTLNLFHTKELHYQLCYRSNNRHVWSLKPLSHLPDVPGGPI